MDIEKLNLNNESDPSIKQEKIVKPERDPIPEPLCGGCGEQLREAGTNYKNKQIWRCENKKCGREGAGVVIEEEGKE